MSFIKVGKFSAHISSEVLCASLSSLGLPLMWMLHLKVSETVSSYPFSAPQTG